MDASDLLTRILLWPEHVTTHVWKVSNGAKEDVNARELGLPAELEDRLDSWGQQHLAASTAMEKAEARIEGFDLAAAVQRELGEQFEVFYLSGHPTFDPGSPLTPATDGNYEWRA